jgi:hypothetical protein
MSKIDSLIGKINNGQNPLFEELYGTDSDSFKGTSKQICCPHEGI